jgi:hypothetical protein
MMKTKLFMIACLFIVGFASSSWADDTIYCPEDETTLNDQCRRTNANIRRYKAQIARVERYVNDPNFLFVSFDREPGETTWAYKARGETAPYEETRRGTRIYPSGRYFDTSTEKYYWVIARSEYRQYLTDELGPGSNLARTIYNEASRNTRFIKNNRFNGNNGNLTRWRRNLQRMYLFRAQCCKGRWTNDPPPGDNTPPNRCQGRLNLLGKCVD